MTSFGTNASTKTKTIFYPLTVISTLHISVTFTLRIYLTRFGDVSTSADTTAKKLIAVTEELEATKGGVKVDKTIGSIDELVNASN